MSQEAGGPRDDRGDGLLRALDPDLNIFALANGMDLYRDFEGSPDRVLEWFRDGLERRIHVSPSAGDGEVDLQVAALGKVDGVRRAGRRTFRQAVSRADLRGVLAEAIEAANGFERDALDPA